MFKGMCYIVLIVAFLLFFNKDPVFCTMIVGGGVGIYAFFKLRKKRNSSSSKSFGFFSKNPPIQTQQSSDIRDLMMLIAMQQMFSSQKSDNIPINNIKTEKNGLDEKSNKKKQQILDLLEED